MYLVVGLGNPEPDYSRTRHNMGFDVINKFASNNDIEFKKNKFEALYADGKVNGEKVILIKPQTYMNLSGNAVGKYVEFYKIPLENIIVIYDDMDVEKGKIKIRKKGSSGGHNGMKSIIQALQSEDFARVRVGIGKPQYGSDIINYVINRVDDGEYKLLEDGIEKGVKAVEEMLKSNIDIAMNKYN